MPQRKRESRRKRSHEGRCPRCRHDWFVLDRAAGRLGVEHIFGIPGDYILTLYKMIEESPIKLVNMTREDNAGFAADAYARIHGLGCICVTYCVGGLSTCNSIAGAYAEKSPVIVLGARRGCLSGRTIRCCTTRSRDSRRNRGVPEDHGSVGGPGSAGDGVQRDRPGFGGGGALQAAGVPRNCRGTRCNPSKSARIAARGAAAAVIPRTARGARRGR